MPLNLLAASLYPGPLVAPNMTRALAARRARLRAYAVTVPAPDSHSTAFHQNAVFSFNPSQRPWITVGLMGDDRMFHPVKLMVDSGNDLTLISRETAANIGLDPRRGSSFQVAGISQQGQEFKQLQTMLKISNFRPIPIHIGVGDIKDDLLGREDVYENFEIIFDPDKITFRQRADINMSNADDDNTYL
jgi:Aspartyl protease